MTDNLRDRIAAVIHQCDPRPVADTPSVHDFHVADAVIRELGLESEDGESLPPRPSCYCRHCDRKRVDASTIRLTGDCEAVFGDNVKLVNVHDESQCRGRVCVIHRPTEHHMRPWPLHWRGDRLLFERLCPHGVGHPDPDQFDYWEATGRRHLSIHGCDFCCQPPREIGNG